jgi:hypothetical protein
MRGSGSLHLTRRNEICALIEVEGPVYLFIFLLLSFYLKKRKKKEIAGGGSRCTLGGLRHMRGLRGARFVSHRVMRKREKKETPVGSGFKKEYERFKFRALVNRCRTS